MDSSRADAKLAELDQTTVHRERRAHSRLYCKGIAEFRILPDGPKVIGFLANLSLGGCSIECENEIPAKPQASVEVQLNVDDFRLRLAGCIRHIDKEFKVGIQFTDVSSRKEEQIRHLIAEHVEMERHRLAVAKAMRMDGGEE